MEIFHPAKMFAIDRTVEVLSSRIKSPLQHLTEVNWNPGMVGEEVDKFFFRFVIDAPEIKEVQVIFLEYDDFEVWNGPQDVWIHFSNGTFDLYHADSKEGELRMVQHIGRMV